MKYTGVFILIGEAMQSLKKEEQQQQLLFHASETCREESSASPSTAVSWIADAERFFLCSESINRHKVWGEKLSCEIRANTCGETVGYHARRDEDGRRHFNRWHALRQWTVLSSYSSPRTEPTETKSRNWRRRSLQYLV